MIVEKDTGLYYANLMFLTNENKLADKNNTDIKKVRM